jgi:hypothetical protein
MPLVRPSLPTLSSRRAPVPDAVPRIVLANAPDCGSRHCRRHDGATGDGVAVDPNDKGKGLQLEFTVEDEGVFTMPWSATGTYRRIRGEWPEHVCAENPHVYYEKDTAVPTADKPDF